MVCGLQRVSLQRVGSKSAEPGLHRGTVRNLVAGTQRDPIQRAADGSEASGGVLAGSQAAYASPCARPSVAAGWMRTSAASGSRAAPWWVPAPWCQHAQHAAAAGPCARAACIVGLHLAPMHARTTMQSLTASLPSSCNTQRQVKRTLRCVYSPGTLLEGVMLVSCQAPSVLLAILANTAATLARCRHAACAPLCPSASHHARSKNCPAVPLHFFCAGRLRCSAAGHAV